VKANFSFMPRGGIEKQIAVLLNPEWRLQEIKVKLRESFHISEEEEIRLFYNK